MGDRLVLDQRHHRGDRDAVVGAQGRPVGGQPVAVAQQDDPPLGRIVRACRVALAHHVQVTLEDEGGRSLTALTRRNANHEVPAGVLLELEPLSSGPLANVLDHRLLVTRRARDRCQRLKMRPEGARFEPGQY